MTTYRVGITRRPEGSVDGWVFDLPGCRAVGGSLAETETLLPVVTAEHLAWLRGHGEMLDSAIDVQVVEDVQGGADLVYEADKAPLRDADIEAAVRQVGYAQADLLAVLRGLPDSVLDWRPPASAVRIDAVYPDVRSIREMVAHVASGMSFQIRAVGSVAERVPVPEGPPDLATAYETAVARLRALTAEERSGRVYHIETPRGASDWTAAKAVRRMINHHRFHTREVEQRLCWLMLGVPEVLPVSRE